MEIEIVNSKAEYEVALAYVASLMDAAPGLLEEAELVRVASLVEEYEAEHYPIGLPDPDDAILFRIDQIFGPHPGETARS